MQYPPSAMMPQAQTEVEGKAELLIAKQSIPGIEPTRSPVQILLCRPPQVGLCDYVSPMSRTLIHIHVKMGRATPVR